MSENNTVTLCYPLIYNSVKIFAVLTGRSCCPKKKLVEDSEYSMPPTEYKKQMLMSFQERLDRLLKLHRDIDVRFLCDNQCEGQCFEVSPRVLIFQQFVPGLVYNTTLTIRNITKAPRQLKRSRQLDPFFSVEYTESAYSNTIAPGLVHVYNIRFSPTEMRDYEYHIEFVSDLEVFAVSVIAIGPRAIFDIPDRIEMPTTAVKIPSSKTIAVRNVGNTSAIFNFSINQPCFSIEPSKGILNENEMMQLTVKFLSEKSGHVETVVYLNFQTGEKFCVTLCGSTKSYAIQLNKKSIRMMETYLGLSRSKILTIHNKSDYIVKFQWMRYKDTNMDMERKAKYEELFQLVHDQEIMRRASLVYYNICLPDIHKLVCQRIYADEIASLQQENFHYNHMSFLLIPEAGEIWPQSSTNVTVIFRAMEMGETCSVAYLEVSGREDRIPLSLCGISKGPLLQLNVITINFKNIFLCSVHNYQIVAANKGYICGTLIYKEKPTIFGGQVEVIPPSLTLNPDEYKSFNLAFSSKRKGDFVERIDFVIKESLEVISLHVKGCIICPTLHFDKSILDFGTIAIGYSIQQEVCLLNLSLVPVSYHAFVMNDGDEAPIIHEEFARAEVKPNFPKNPREFTIHPHKGVVQAQGSLELKITYTANIARIKETSIRVEMWDSDSDPVILPITFCSVVPNLSINPSNISIRFCFLNFPYSRLISVENKSDLDGYFCIIPQTVSEEMPVIYSLSYYQGLLKARQSKEIQITIITKTLGVQTAMLNMLTMGEEVSAAVCLIECNGQGPVISVQPTSVNFGEIEVLQKKVMSFRITNDSPISAQFKISDKNSIWSVKPTSGHLESNEYTEIEIEIFLRNVGKYTSNMILQILNSRSISINITAIGIGCSIVFEPKIFPIFDMGFLFSHQDQNIPIIMSNLSTYPYQIIWSTELDIRVQKNQIESKFQIEPLSVEIPANNFRTVQCKARWDINEAVMENWYIFGQTNKTGKGKRELIGISMFKAVFTKPQIVFSKKELIFRIDMYSKAEDPQDINELIVTNESQLNLNALLYVKFPFYLLKDHEVPVRKKKIILMSGSDTKILVKFIPVINFDNPYSRSYSEVLWFEYDEHPNKNKIRCKGAVYFPNITLSCKDLTINCVSGLKTEEILTLTNNGPIPATFKFIWAGESIDIQREADNIDDFNVDRSKFQINPASQKSISPENKENSTAMDGKFKTNSNKNGDESARIATSSSTIHILQKSKLDELMERIQGDTLDETLEKLRNLFPPTSDITCMTCLKIPEILALLDTKFSVKDLLDDILDIVPHEGTLDPFSSQCVRFVFYGSEPMQVKAIALCEIFQGPTEVVNVFASADIVQYFVDRQIIDFGLQFFDCFCQSSFTLENRSKICLHYEIKERESEKNRSTICALLIEPNEGTLNPLSSTKIAIKFEPILLGAFEIEFELQVAYVDPLILIAKGVTSYPQIYLCIPREDIKDIKFMYQAIHELTSDYIAMKRRELKIKCENNADNDESKNQMHEWDKNILLDNDWNVITHEELYPSIMDIEMVIERALATQFIKECSFILTQYPTPYRNVTIPLISTPYIIDMNYVIINLQTVRVITIINYGPWQAEIILKKLSKNQLEDSGISLQFHRMSLTVGETTTLTVTWQPTLAKYADKSFTEEEHIIYLEVVHGCPSPLIIKGIITYPFVTVDTKLLDFQTVIVGECLMMNIVVKNEGFIECCWEATVANVRRRQKECPFHLSATSNILAASCSDIISIYFKPHRTAREEANLKITVEAGLKTQMVTLRGRGIEHKLHISETDVIFPATTLFTEVQQKVLTIENVRDFPVELSWQHLDSVFLEEDRLAEALTHYYGVEEILLPPREVGEKISPFLMEFYNSLIKEMAYTLSTEMFEKENGENEMSNLGHKTRRRSTKKSSSTSRLSDRHRYGTSKTNPRTESNVESNRWKRKKITNSSASLDFTKKNCPSMTIFSEFDFPHEPPILPTHDPEEIQQLLFCYIELLHNDPDFPRKMKNPVKELFDRLQTKLISELDLSEFPQPAKKVCIIFHGAPFTEYQETACRSAKELQVPMLYINNVITEGIALSNQWFSIKIRHIIDTTYKELLSTLEKQKDNLKIVHEKIKLDEGYDEGTTAEQGDHEKSREQVADSQKETKLDSEATIEIDEQIVDDASAQGITILFEGKLVKIPREQDLKSLDPVSVYEYKIEGILLLQKILPLSQDRIGSKEKNREKDTKKNQDNFNNNQDKTFLEIEVDLLTEVLRERLSLADFNCGFILQTLNNIFFKNDITTLLALLNIVGYVEYSLFVTFMNSIDKYTRKMKEIRTLKEEQLAKEIHQKIQRIDKMSLSEYELLDEEDKKFYMESTLPIKKQEALQRQMQFVQRMTEIKKEKKISKKIVKNKKMDKRMKSRRYNEEERSRISKVSKKEDRKQHSPEPAEDIHRKEQEELKELENVTNAMNEYYNSLAAIENILKYWDPLKKDILLTSKTRISKIDKSKDKFPDINKETDMFHFWYINATDPWNRTMYDVVVNQMRENTLAKNALPVEILPKPDLEPKKYYILKPRKIRKPIVETNEIYQIFPLFTIPTDPSNMTINSLLTNANKQENQVENPKGRKNLYVVEENISLNTTESKDTNTSNMNVIFRLETLKPRWILQPNESQKFKIRYQPEEIGLHQHLYTLSIINDDITYDINVYGIADVPRLDMNPNTIFSRVKETKVDNITEPTYFSDTDIYDLGSLLVFRENESEYRSEAELKFCNVSNIDMEVYFYLQENNLVIFTMDIEKLYIEAGQCKLLKISAGVTKLGTFTNKLYICITNNPHVDTIKLECSGMKLDIELENKQLSFGQMLIYRKDFATCVIRNKSPVEIFWQLHPDEALDPQILFKPSSGVINAWSDGMIEFCYQANQIGVMETTFTFQAFFYESDVEPIFMDTITLSAETYEVAVDICHVNPINLQPVRIGFCTSADFVINNHGNHDIKYVVLLEAKTKLPKIVSSLFKNLKEQIQINPTSGTVEPQKEAIVKVTFTPKEEIMLECMPIFLCQLFDVKKQVKVAEFPLMVSLIAYYTKFEIYPYPEVSFAPLGVCTQQTMNLNIENVGQFPLYYFISKCLPDKEGLLERPSTAMTQYTKAETGHRKKDLDKMPDTCSRKKSSRIEKKSAELQSTLKVGTFTVLKIEGDIQPGETDVVEIQCYPELESTQEEKIMLFVPDAVPEDREKLIKLSAKSYVPSIDFEDLDAIFGESHIINYIEDFIYPKDIDAHTVFDRQEKCLYFRYVKVASTHSTDLLFYNRNVIPADMRLTLLASSFVPKTVEPDQIFTSTPEREHIPPMDHKRFTISFSPKLLETYSIDFEATVELPPQFKHEKLSVKLIGQACIPEVEIIEPFIDQKTAVVNFGRTLMNDYNEKKFVLSNIGVISVQIIGEIHEDLNSFFSLNIYENTRNVTSCQAEGSAEQCIMIHLIPAEMTSFEIRFQPRQIGKYSAKLHLIIVDHPNDKMVINLMGNAYFEKVVLQELELTDIKYAEKSKSQKLISTINNNGITAVSILLAYKLDFEYCFVNNIYKKSFKISNRTTDCYVRFQWGAHSNITFSPSVGHLKPLFSKKIVVEFSPLEPANYVETCLYCTICEIVLLDEPLKELFWDDRETKVHWTPINDEIKAEFAKKVIEPVQEPSYEIIPETTKYLQVLLNAVVTFSEQ